MGKHPIIICLVYLVCCIFTASSQEIRLEQTIYVVSEDVPTRHLALLVCVEGINLEDQAFNIGIKTEDFSDSCAATDGQDYMGVDEELVLGPGEDYQCVCIEIIEDDQDEKEEIFGIRISGSPVITIDSANVTIRDNDGTSFVFTGDTPNVEGNVVTFDLQFEGGVTSATCGVTTQAAVDCSNGRAQFTLPPNRVRQFQPIITTSGLQGQSDPVIDPNRRFRIGSHGRCPAHLINEGIVYNPITGDTTFEWGWSGPGAVGRYLCQLDTLPTERCAPEHVISGLSDGQHTLVIRVKDGDCQGRFRRFLSFNIPLISN